MLWFFTMSESRHIHTVTPHAWHILFYLFSWQPCKTGMTTPFLKEGRLWLSEGSNRQVSEPRNPICLPAESVLSFVEHRCPPITTILTKILKWKCAKSRNKDLKMPGGKDTLAAWLAGTRKPVCSMRSLKQLKKENVGKGRWGVHDKTSNPWPEIPLRPSIVFFSLTLGR